MLTAVHTLIYSTDPTVTRRFFKEVLQWPCVTEGPTDEPEEWLIFRTGPSETGVHPTAGPAGQTWGREGEHQITLVCDDLDATMAELAAMGHTVKQREDLSGDVEAIRVLPHGSLQAMADPRRGGVALGF